MFADGPLFAEQYLQRLVETRLGSDSEQPTPAQVTLAVVAELNALIEDMPLGALPYIWREGSRVSRLLYDTRVHLRQRAATVINRRDILVTTSNDRESQLFSTP